MRSLERDRIRLADLEIRHADLEIRHAEAVASGAAARQYLDGMRSADRLVELDFPVRPRVRFGWQFPPQAQLQSRFEGEEHRFDAVLRQFLPLQNIVCQITPHAINPGQPYWINDWFPALDAISLYGLLVTGSPRRLIEIGSGNSTLFARRAIQDHALKTTIVSIDPAPRAEVDAQCDKVIRKPLEDVEAEFFRDIHSNDVIFFDGSHRAFQNSDATVFFTEILPVLPQGTVVGVHDIFLPYDYPHVWLSRWYSEQYLLACWLLGGTRLRVELPVAYCSTISSLHGILAPFWSHPALAGANHFGGAFWFLVSG